MSGESGPGGSTRVIEADEQTAPTVRRRRISGRNDATMRTVLTVDGSGTIVTDEPEAHGGTNTGPTPLTTVLGALCGCEGVTFNRTAAELGLVYDGIDFVADFTIDIRGRNGDRAVRPHFQTVRMEATVTTAASAEQLEAVVTETEARCPVYNLLVDAGVRVETVWLRRAPGE
jgi:uncharacterized OsmC-like protein